MVRSELTAYDAVVAAIMKENDGLQIQTDELKQKEQSLSALIANERKEAARTQAALQELLQGEG